MFLLNNNPLPTDVAFTANGIQYPANWLRLSSAEEKAAIGITEVADPVRADDRFYWNGEVANPRPLETLQETFVAQVKDTANKLLASTDWMVIRKVERDVAIPANIVTYRAAVITSASANETAINGASDVEALQQVVSSLTWPTLETEEESVQPVQEEQVVEENTIEEV
jgi:hypothetical protein